MISYEKISAHNKNKEGVKCMICNHYYFKDNFDYQPHVCNKCHDFYGCNGFKRFLCFKY